MKTNNKGFSLVELIVVIAIMAILAAVAIPTFATFINRANEASDEGYANDIEYAVKIATAAESINITGITVVYDKSDKAIVTLYYTDGTKTYDVIGTATGHVAAPTEAADLIKGTIDKKYLLKTSPTAQEPVMSESGILTLTAQD